MCKRQILVCAVILGCNNTSESTPPPPPPEHTPAPVPPDPGSLDSVRAAAAAAGKPVVIELSSTWCEPCKLFAARVLPLPAVQAELAKVTFVTYDIENGNGPAVAKKFNVNILPAFITIDANGAERRRAVGSNPTDPTWFIDFLRKATTT